MDHFMIASCVTACIIICAIVSIIEKIWRRPHLVKQASKFPGPSTLPIIGNAHLFAGSTEVLLDKAFQLGNLYPTPYRLWIGNHLVIVVNTPEQLKVVLHSPKSIDKGPIYEFAQPYLGTGLLTGSGTKWRVHRKLMQSTFSLTILKSFIGIFAARSEMMAKNMERNLDGPEFQIIDYALQCTLQTVCETTMGVDLEATQTNGVYAEALEKVTAGLFERFFSPWLHPNFVFNHTQLGKDQKNHIKFLHTFTNNVIHTKKKQLLEQSSRPSLADNEEDTGDRISQRKILLDHLLEISRNSGTMSDEEVREEVDTIIATGMGMPLIVTIIKAHASLTRKNYSAPPLYTCGHGICRTRNRQPKIHLIFSQDLVTGIGNTWVIAEICWLDARARADELGSETTAGMVSYAMLMLSYHPEIQAKVYEQLCEIYEDDDSGKPVHFTPKNLTRMTCLERVIKETMRLFPIAPFIGRTVKEDLKLGEHTLPKGCFVAFSTMELHRNADYWPDPLKFDPDRFLPEEVKKRDPYAYLPFSGGPRNCIGSKYAMMSMKILLATILRKYILKKDTIVPMEDLRFRWEIVLRPVDPITLRIERRTQKVASI